MDHQQPDLARLLVAIADGDRAAFRRLYEATAPKLFGVVLRIIRTRAEAEDVLQDVYLKIWTKAGSYDAHAGSALGWMASVARNRAIDVVRSKAPVARAESDDGSDWLERVPDPRDAMAELADGDALRHCLQTLEGQARDLLVLAYCEGYSREELAARAGRPVNTIKTWLHRGLATLKSCLDAKT